MSEPLNELIVIPKESALQVFTAPGSIDPYLEQIRASVTGIVPDLSTKKGRDAVASLAYKIAKSKTYLDSVGKELVDELKKQPALIDATRKRARDFLDQLKDEVRRPLTEWEAEQARIEAERQARLQAINDSIEEIRAAGRVEFGTSAMELCGRIEALNADVLTPERYGDRTEEAEQLRAQVLADLKQKHQEQLQREAEAAELARLRAEAAAREQQEREQRIAREAAERAQREAQEEAERQVREAQEAAERAELQRQQAQQRAEQAEREAQARAEQAAEQERQRIEDEQRQAAEEAARREADRDHRKAINTAALQAFIAGGLTEEAARQAVTLIAQRRIPAVSIAY